MAMMVTKDLVMLLGLDTETVLLFHDLLALLTTSSSAKLRGKPLMGKPENGYGLVGSLDRWRSIETNPHCIETGI
jgi:hypothetical protein